MDGQSGSVSRPDAPARLALTMGDPGGIGPEVIAKALADERVRDAARWTVIGLERPWREAASAAGLAHAWAPVAERPSESRRVPDGDVTLVEIAAWVADAPSSFPREASAIGGRHSLWYLNEAIRRAMLARDHPEHVDGIVTAPISKAAWALAGEGRFPGHTELLAERFGVRRYAMMFDSPALRVALVTIHVPLAEVPRRITTARVLEVIELADEACRRDAGERPRVAVCGVNPHAGEGGILGREDEEHIRPAVEMAKAKGIRASGPHPGDSVFLSAVKGEFDVVVAMYHDQGLIPLKLLARDHAVNFTVGLPIVRTSPDHGTAFDIAGKNLADPGSMKAAMLLAARLVACRRARA